MHLHLYSCHHRFLAQHISPKPRSVCKCTHHFPVLRRLFTDRRNHFGSIVGWSAQEVQSHYTMYHVFSISLFIHLHPIPLQKNLLFHNSLDHRAISGLGLQLSSMCRCQADSGEQTSQGILDERRHIAGSDRNHLLSADSVQLLCDSSDHRPSLHRHGCTNSPRRRHLSFLVQR